MHSSSPKSPSDLRTFGLVMAGAFGLIGGVLWWKDVAAAPYVLGVAAFFGIAGLVVPRLLGPIEWAWMKLALVLSAIMTRVILTLAFFLIITPIGLLLRLMGKDLLQTTLDPEQPSYWTPVEPDGPGTRPEKPY